MRPHGTVSRYRNNGCRCDLCREAHRVSCLNYTRTKGVRPRDEYLADAMSHGINAYKKRGCRCEVCRAASAAQKRRYRAKLTARGLS